MNKKTKSMLIVLLMLVGGAAAWFSLRQQASPEFATVNELAETLIDEENSLSESERNEGWTEVKQKWEFLTKLEQKTLMAKIQAREIETRNQFFELETEEERNAFLDKELDRWDAKKRPDGKAKKKGGDKTKSGRNKTADASKKRIDHDALREKLRDHLDSKTADERAKERIYWTALKDRWAKRHGDKSTK